MTSTASAATSTSTSMAMSDSMTTMDMVFFTSQSTPLFSQYWAPSSTTAYAFTCIFLIALAVILRLLYAVKSVAEANWARKNARRSYIVVQPDRDSGDDGTPYRDDDRQKEADGARLRKPISAARNNPDRMVKVEDASIGASSLWIAPWRWSVDFPRALLYTIIVGVGYLE